MLKSLFYYIVNYHRLVFPSIFIVYMMIDILVVGKCTIILRIKENEENVVSISEFIIMVGYMDRNKLFCSSRSLIETMREVTPFCVVSGK